MRKKHKRILRSSFPLYYTIMFYIPSPALYSSVNILLVRPDPLEGLHLTVIIIVIIIKETCNIYIQNRSTKGF